MKEHQCIKQERCTKCELWHEIFLFFSKQEDAIISDKQEEILIRFKEFFDKSNCNANCWNVCFNDNCKECKSWKNVHNQLKTCELSYCKHYQTWENWNNYNIVITLILLSRSQKNQRYSFYLKTQDKRKNSKKEQAF